MRTRFVAELPNLTW